MLRSCRCHGPTASCQIKTCWDTIQPLGFIANELRKKFHSAIRVRSNSKRTKLLSTYRKARPSRSDLVYINQSPNFCRPDPILGIPGSRGRKCDVHSAKANGCQIMCCGRGYRTVRRYDAAKCPKFPAENRDICIKYALEHRCR